MRLLVERSLRAGGATADGPAVDRALAIFLEHYRAHLLDATTLYPGVADTVARLRAAGVVLSIATNKPHAMALAILAGLDLGDAFAAVLGGDSLAAHKPDPEIVRELLRRTGTAAASTLLVGDSLVDVATARAAGVPVCAVTWGLTAAATLRDAAPDHVVDAPEELLRLV